MIHLAAFSDYIRNEKRYSEHTLTAYVNDIEQFFYFTADQYEVSKEEEVTAPIVKSWMYELMEQDISARSVNRKLSALKTYFKYLLRRELLKSDPLTFISGLKTDKRLTQFMPEKEIEKIDTLSAELFEAGFKGMRDRLIIELLYGTGMREAELIGLKKKDVNTSQGEIKVLGKRNKERIIPITRPLAQFIEDYLLARHEQFSGAEYLLVTDKGKQLYPIFVYRVVNRFMKMIGSQVSKKSPHVLRHTYATHLLNNGADINAIKELLGHSSLASTQVYTHNSIEKLKEIYKQAHPKGEK